MNNRIIEQLNRGYMNNGIIEKQDDWTGLLNKRFMEQEYDILK